MKRQAAQHPRLGVRIPKDAARARVDEQQLTRRQTSAAHDLRRIERDRTGFGGHGDHAVRGLRPGGRSQPVPVEQRPDAAPVAEHERGGTVPGRDEPGHPPAEGGDGGMRGPAQRRRLRYQREQRGLERPAGAHQQLQRLVQRLRVGRARGEERPGGPQPVRGGAPACGDSTVALASADRLAVATDRVDLTVVGDVAERLRKRPGRVGVGGIPLVEHGERDVDRRGEVREEGAQPVARDEALVDDRPRRRRGDREPWHAGRAPGGIGTASGAGEGQLEPRVGCIGRAWDQRVEDVRQRRRGLPAELSGVDRHGAPDWSGKPLGSERLGDDLARVRDPVRAPAGSNPGPLRGCEHGEHARSRPGPPPWIDHVQQRRGDRQQDAGAVAGGAVRGECAAMPECGEPAERERQDPRPGAPACIGDEPDTAGVVLVARVVERRLRVPAGASLWRDGGALAHLSGPSSGARDGKSPERITVTPIRVQPSRVPAAGRRGWAGQTW